jgi:Uma2 family endonuclease
LLKACYVAARGGMMTDFYVGVNMFVYFSMDQVRNRDYKGPDVYFVTNDADGQRPRLYWAIWEEGGRYPDVIIEFLSQSTEHEDLGPKKDLYERVFKAAEYFCAAPQVERLLGWRLNAEQHYEPIVPDMQGRLWSRQLGFFLGAWQGPFMGETQTWLRLYGADGRLTLLPEEAERERADRAEQRAELAEQHAETERKRAEELAARIAALEAELQRTKGNIEA